MNKWLAPLAWLYGQGVARRRRLARRTPPQKLPVPVISVGNITVGGTGKTEAVVLLCRLLVARGYRPGVLTRGYRRRSRAESLIVSRGQGPEVTVEEAGDEPFLMARRLKNTAVVVGVERALTGRRAVMELGCDVLVLDDGFQRRDTLDRDIDLVLVDAADPLGRGNLLPAGRLREPLSALAEADALILTRADQYAVMPALAELGRLAPDVPRLTARHRAIGLAPLAGGPAHALETLAGRRVLAVSGIARPEAFEHTLESLGAEVVGSYRFRDHHWYTAGDCERIRRHALALQADVVTTTKDAVRLHWPSEGPVKAWFLEIELEIMPPAQALEILLERALK